MSFRQKCRKSLEAGKKVTIHYNGLEYIGEVIEVDTSNPQDSHVTLKTSEGERVILPITQQMAITEQPEKIVAVDDDEIDDEEVPKKSKKNSRK